MTTRDTVGREPITIVEIDVDRCELTYGVLPCEAVLGVTGTTKCFNTFATCQDTENISVVDTLTLRFCNPSEHHDPLPGYVTIPSVISVDTVPTRINIADSSADASPLGERAKITCTLRDHPYHDGLTDPYRDDRDYLPVERGTFWSKFLARNPFYQGRSLRVRQGYFGQTIDQMTVRHYIMERIEGPSQDEVKVIAQDPLKLVDDTRSQAPVPNTGTLTLPIPTGALASLSVEPAGIGNLEYSASGFMRIGSELFSFTRAADLFTIGSRALRGTTDSTHAAGDVVQEVLAISGMRVDALLQFLLEEYAGIDPAFIDFAGEWEPEADLWLNGFDMSAWITEPTGIATLVTEVLSQGACFIWWDEDLQLVRFRAIRPFFALTDSFPVEISDDFNIVADSVEIEERPEERISRLLIHYSQINPTAGIADPANYARQRLQIDDEAESSLQYNEIRQKRIFARFMDDANDAATSVLASRILQRTVTTPKVIKFSTDVKDADAVKTGNVISFIHHAIVDSTGAALPTLVQITSYEESEPGHRIDLEGRPYLSGGGYAFIMADDLTSPFVTYSTATETEKEEGGFIAPDVNGFANGDPPYTIL